MSCADTLNNLFSRDIFHRQLVSLIHPFSILARVNNRRHTPLEEGQSGPGKDPLGIASVAGVPIQLGMAESLQSDDQELVRRSFD